MTAKWICKCDETPPDCAACMAKSPQQLQCGNRYYLGQCEQEVSKNTLVCIGLNPSTARLEQLDTTLNRVRQFAISKDFDSWIMFNIYPRRSTQPSDIGSICDEEIVRNCGEICTLLSTMANPTIWCAWGDNGYKSKFQKSLTQLLYSILQRFPNIKICIRENQKGRAYPFHPLARVSFGSELIPVTDKIGTVSAINKINRDYEKGINFCIERE